MEPCGSKVGDRLSRHYPKVDETETPLPRVWSTKDKYTYIGLSQANLRVHYKGSGKNHKDAASVRVCQPIPAACGVYYFEVKVISKGRDGYMGVGLSDSGVNLNRLPGWEKNSYGYHADDGCVFNSSGTGQKYGPTFSTGDVIGCGFNLLDRSIFFTKNGRSLGTAVADVPATLELYPTVGLQTPGEIMEANFGECSFVFDFEGMLAEMQQQVKQAIVQLPISDGIGVWQASLHKVVLSYLVHHGYSQTAHLFAGSTGQSVGEESASITSRQRIQSLVLRGRISEAIQVVLVRYKGLLEENPDLLFRLKCRQFVEMIGGYDQGEVTPPRLEPRLSCHSELDASYGSPNHLEEESSDLPRQSQTIDNVAMMNGDESVHTETAMEVDHCPFAPEEETLDRTPVAIEKVLRFGRDLQGDFSRLTSDKANEQLKSVLQDSFSLLAYTEPRTSPVGYLLDPIQREPVCAALNSAILESQHLPGQPPLEFALGQAVQCLKHMSRNGLGAAAFTGVQDIINS